MFGSALTVTYTALLVYVLGRAASVPLFARHCSRKGLSGHTHGGQIWPFGFIVQRVYPLLRGRYDIDGMPVIVCGGTGTWGPRMRLWRRGEILKVTLRAPRRPIRP